MAQKWFKRELLRKLFHVGALLPLAKIVFDFFSDNLTANPIQAIEQQTGKYALILLVLSLACTPIASILGLKKIIPYRKLLGNYGFFYAAVHVSIFVGVDYALNIFAIWRDVGTKWYILIGLSAFLLLIPLAITSTNYWMKRLGKNWKIIHRAVYLISPLVVVHYLLSVKGDFLRLAGNIIQPLSFAFVIALLLVVRIPLIKTAMIGLRIKLSRLLVFSS